MEMCHTFVAQKLFRNLWLLPLLVISNILLDGCSARNLNPWLSPTEIQIKDPYSVQVEGGEIQSSRGDYCLLLTGRLVPEGWASTLYSKRGARLRLRNTREESFRSGLLFLVVAREVPGQCEPVFDSTGRLTHDLPAGFGAYIPLHFTLASETQASRPQLRVEILNVESRDLMSSGHLQSLQPEKIFPWPFWPWTQQWAPGISPYWIQLSAERSELLEALRSGQIKLVACALNDCASLTLHGLQVQ
jgi:hypothetical protein